MENNSRESRRRTLDGRVHSPSRELILGLLERGSLTTSQIVTQTGLHQNTVRGHLEQLQQDGYITRTPLPPQGRGRPASAWSAKAGTTPYADLASVLAAALQSGEGDPVAASRMAGIAWGKQIAAELDSSGSGLSAVIDGMRLQGFAPELPDGAQKGTTSSIVLRRCPLFEAAKGNEAVVCAAHEGMIEGIAKTRDPLVETTLVPYAVDGACALEVRCRS